ncbi:hypothetical protein GC197_00700 [bacterium]|nr:hypothetical protein [bacterium]
MSLVKRPNRDRRTGMTIVELLVVLGVMAILLGIAATAVKNGTRGKKQREAARQVNAFIASAQARAMELGRPVGIEIVRSVFDSNNNGVVDVATDTGLSNAGLMMFMVETPPPYAGDEYNSALTFSETSGVITLTDNNTQFTASSVLFATGNPVEVRLNYRGPRYQATVTNNSPLTLTFNRPAHDHSIFNSSVPVQIFSRPVRNSVPPLQLPTDMCIDLSCSGEGVSGNEFTNWNVYNTYNSGTNPIDGNEPIRITFSPSGNIHRIYPDGRNERYPHGNVHLLVGKYDYALNALDVMGTNGLNDVTAFPSSGTPVNYESFINATDTPTNLADGTAMWVSINYQTGQVTTTRNRYIGPGYAYASTTTPTKNQEILLLSREFATSVLTVQGEGNQ